MTTTFTTTKRPIIVGIGELLWDVFPGGKHLGGAPTNFALMAAQLSNQGVIASRVGLDAHGEEALQRLEERGMNTRFIQHDDHHPTGTAHIGVNAAGQPSFSISGNAAWDFFDWTPSWEELASMADAVSFGMLAQRSPASRHIIRRFLESTRADCLRVFDVNLRQPFHPLEGIAEMLELSDIVKLSDEEVTPVAEMLKLDGGRLRASAEQLLRTFNLKLVCITRGARGCLLVSETGAVEHPGFEVAVSDPVGSGDAFTAALVHHYLRGAELQRVAEAANRLGSWVASHTGATPALDKSMLDEVLAG